MKNGSPIWALLALAFGTACAQAEVGEVPLCGGER